jgi:hypothetical protein
MHLGQSANPLQEGEFVIMKDDPNANDWYCAEIRKILADRIDAYPSTHCSVLPVQ